MCILEFSLIVMNIKGGILVLKFLFLSRILSFFQEIMKG